MDQHSNIKLDVLIIIQEPYFGFLGKANTAFNSIIKKEPTSYQTMIDTLNFVKARKMSLVNPKLFFDLFQNIHAYSLIHQDTLFTYESEEYTKIFHTRSTPYDTSYFQ